MRGSLAGVPGACGNEAVDTPCLDRLAAESIRYTRAYTASGVCAPSRSSIITGLYPTAIGTHHMRTLGGPAPHPRRYDATHGDAAVQQADSGRSAEDAVARGAFREAALPPYAAVLPPAVAGRAKDARRDLSARDAIRYAGRLLRRASLPLSTASVYVASFYRLAAFRGCAVICQPPRPKPCVSPFWSPLC